MVAQRCSVRMIHATHRTGMEGSKETSLYDNVGSVPTTLT